MIFDPLHGPIFIEKKGGNDMTFVGFIKNTLATLGGLVVMAVLYKGNSDEEDKRISKLEKKLDKHLADASEQD